MSFEEIKQRLLQLHFNEEVLVRYDEHHRYYHNFNHLQEVLIELRNKQVVDDDELFLAAVFHDAVYDSRKQDNEEQSALLFKEEAKNASYPQDKTEVIAQLILDTKYHQPTTEKSKLLIDADLNIFNASTARLIEYEKQILKEYQHVDFLVYREKRIEVLQKFNTNHRLDFLIDYVKSVHPVIAVFPGSFNPFHKGHFNVLQKAEQIFDKVIIAFGKNPEKQNRSWEIPKTIQNRQIASYEGLVTDFVDSLGYEVIIIRGLRNSTDFQYEQNQYRYIQELKPKVKIVSVFCDKEYEHISSSGIRTLEKYNKHKHYLLD
jgi:pantetheine-phosphate adenylyltransferase